MKEGTDVLVIGGGPAGLATAIAARKKGFEVTVVDGAKPPIDKACGEGLMPNTLAALRELGVAICPADGQALRGIRFKDEVIQPWKQISPVPAVLACAEQCFTKRWWSARKSVEITLLWNTPVAGLSEGWRHSLAIAS